MGDNTPTSRIAGNSSITIRHTTLPTGALMDTPADQLWLGLHELVNDDTACDLFDAAARMARAEAQN